MQGIGACRLAPFTTVYGSQPLTARFLSISLAPTRDSTPSTTGTAIASCRQNQPAASTITKTTFSQQLLALNSRLVRVSQSCSRQTRKQTLMELEAEQNGKNTRKCCTPIGWSPTA